MATEYRDVQDKSAWGDGPWHDEPDKATWVDPETDLDCMIVRNHGGALCGYVGVPKDHPLFGRGMLDAPGFDVHGGITFANGCYEEGPPESSVCHIPEPGRSDEIWWLGFDCSHAWDASPGHDARMRTYAPELVRALRDHESYKPWAYVKGEVEGLAKQVAAIGR